MYQPGPATLVAPIGIAVLPATGIALGIWLTVALVCLIAGIVLIGLGKWRSRNASLAS